MRSRIFLVIGLLLLAIGACTPATPPASVTVTPVSIPNTPTPLPTATNTPLPTLQGIPALAPSISHHQSEILNLLFPLVSFVFNLLL